MQFSASSFAVAMEEAIRVDYLDMRCLARNSFSLDSEHILEACVCRFCSFVSKFARDQFHCEFEEISLVEAAGVFGHARQ